jgi:hypothetical protein
MRCALSIERHGICPVVRNSHAAFEARIESHYIGSQRARDHHEILEGRGADQHRESQPVMRGTRYAAQVVNLEHDGQPTHGRLVTRLNVSAVRDVGRGSFGVPSGFVSVLQRSPRVSAPSELGQLEHGANGIKGKRIRSPAGGIVGPLGRQKLDAVAIVRERLAHLHDVHAIRCSGGNGRR